jgi:hypothetical protein
MRRSIGSARWWAAAIALPTLLLVLGTASACGEPKSDGGVASAAGGDASTATPSATPPSVDPTERARQFAQCMRDNGIDMQDPDPNAHGGLTNLPPGTDWSKVQKAMNACRSLAPNGGEGMKLDPEQQEQLRQWAKCMRDHGVNVPDPNPNVGGMGLDPNSFNRDDPKFKAAFDACQDKFVIRPGGRS